MNLKTLELEDVVNDIINIKFNVVDDIFNQFIDVENNFTGSYNSYKGYVNFHLDDIVQFIKTYVELDELVIPLLPIIVETEVRKSFKEVLKTNADEEVLKALCLKDYNNLVQFTEDEELLSYLGSKFLKSFLIERKNKKGEIDIFKIIHKDEIVSFEDMSNEICETIANQTEQHIKGYIFTIYSINHGKITIDLKGE